MDDIFLTYNSIKPSKELVKNLFSEANGFGEYADVAIELLRKTVEILDAFDIDYFLISGTLLGLVRHNGFIPWDDDIDLIVHGDILGKIESIVESYKDDICVMKDQHHMMRFCFTNAGIKLDGYVSKYWEDRILNHGGFCKWPFIDLFVFQILDSDGLVANDEFSREYLDFFNRNWDYKQFYHAIIVDFMGVRAKMPCNPNYFLESNYGPDYMSVLKSGFYVHKEESRVFGRVAMRKHVYDNLRKD